ncbi:hypothetical protein PAXRUDRAFT_77215, partial [Paxillus rubicundulus Ve08.2h10]
PHSPASSQGKCPLTDISNNPPKVTPTQMDAAAATPGPVTSAGPAAKKKKHTTSESATMPPSMQNAMSISGASSSHHTRVPTEPASGPLLVNLVGAVTHLAGSIECSFLPSEERLSTKKQQAIHVLEGSYSHLPIQQCLLLVQLVGKDDY